MERTDGLLLGGVALVSGSLRRLQNDTVDMTRRDIGDLGGQAGLRPQARGHSTTRRTK